MQQASASAASLPSLRERMRCSSLVDWPVYPPLRRTMQGSERAQCGPVVANERPRALLLASAGQTAERRGQRGAMARRGLNRALMMREQFARDRNITSAE